MQQIEFLLAVFISFLDFLDLRFTNFAFGLLCFTDCPLSDNLLDRHRLGLAGRADGCIRTAEIPHVRLVLLEVFDRLRPAVEQGLVSAVFQVGFLADRDLLDKVIDGFVVVEDLVLQDVNDVLHLCVLFKSL